MTGGLRAILALIIPAAVGMLLLARPAVALLLGNGHSTPAQTTTTGAALALFALGLPGFCVYLYFVRVLQSMQRTKVAFYLYLVENALNVVLAVVLVHPLGVRGLALSLSIAYTVAAGVALVVFRQWFGRLAEPETWTPLWRSSAASVPMAAVVLVVSNLSESTSVTGLLARVVGAIWRAASRSARSSCGWAGATRAGGDRRRTAAPPDRVPRHRAPALKRPGTGARWPPWQTPCMPGVHIVTDSACDLTDQLVKEHNVVVVPLTIRFGQEELEDRRQLTPAEFWERCRGKGALPETAAPSPGAFQAAFQQAVDEGADAVLCVTISSKVSGTYSSATTAADSFGAVPVRVVDSYSLTMGQGLLVIAAAEEAAAGAELDELVTATRDRIPRTRIYGVVGGLEHLQRGGRIGGARALIGSLLNIKPVIQLKDGEVAEESKQRTRARALAYLTAKVAADARRSSASPWQTAPATTSLTSCARSRASRPHTRCWRSSSAPWWAPTRDPTPSVSATSCLPARTGPPGSLSPWQRTTYPTCCRTVPSTRSTPWSRPSTTAPSARPSWPPAASSSASSSPSPRSPSWSSSASASSA